MNNFNVKVASEIDKKIPDMGFRYFMMLLYFSVIEDRAIEIPIVRTEMTILIQRAYEKKTAHPIKMT